MEFKPIKARKVYEEIVEQVIGMITQGKINPGDKLLPERELAERLQVGRSAVREAYRALEALGVLEIKPGEGTFVREISNKPMTDIMSWAVVTGKDTLFELLELRKIIETGAAALAATRRTEEDLTIIRTWIDRMKYDIENGNLGDTSDVKFHYAITSAAHNSLLSRLMDSISETMKKEMKVVREKLHQTSETPGKIYNQHEIIYEAIAKGDEQAARLAMLDHLSRAEKGLKEKI